MTTYETSQALKSLHNQPDPIHWSTPHSYRSCPYRQLYHQKGIVGTISVQLIQAKNLKRSHWNALAMGPVKYLGLSSAHGEVSSFATFGIGFVSSYEAKGRSESDDEDESTSSSLASSAAERSAVAAGTASPMLPTPPTSSYATSSTGRNMASHSPSPLHYPYAAASPIDNDYYYNNSLHPYHEEREEDKFRSSTIPKNNNPIWPNNEKDVTSKFDIPLKKGASTRDGKRIMLNVQFKEERTAAECFVPGPLRGSCVKNMKKNRHAHEEADGLIGKGRIDITGLCLGEDVPRWAGDKKKEKTNNRSVEKVGVWDVWLDLSLSNRHYASAAAASSSKKSTKGAENDTNHNDFTGKVRLLISYKPNGLSPIRHDIVALESHARRDVLSSSCRPALPPLEPFKVLDVKGCFLLVEYELPLASNYNVAAMMAASSKKSEKKRDRRRHRDSKKNNPAVNMPIPQQPNTAKRRKGTMRLHRNAVFVVERTNIIDGAVNIALTPTDIFLSTPFGKALMEVTGPYVEAAGDLIMPAVLSAKLFLGATKSGVHAGFIGVKVATESFMKSQLDPVERGRGRTRARRRKSFDR